MVATQETLDELEDIGLNMYERKIYSALLARGVSTAGQLSEMTDVPRSRAYDVLESLADKGFTVIKSSQPMEYVSIPPQQAVENIKQRKKSEIEDEIKKLDKFKESEAVDELESLYDQGVELVEPEEMSGSLKGSHQVAQHLGTMFQEAEEQIKLMTTEEGLIDITEDHSDTLEEASKNDVEVKLMAPLTDRNREHKQEVEDFAQFKDLDPDHDSGRPEGEFAIVDGEASTLSLTPDEVHSTQETAFWTESDHVASNTMEPLFDTVWHSSN
jgi:sugar-specific transcriptional regulator TrmB